MTSSARDSSVGGRVSPNAFAVLRLITSWYLVRQLGRQVAGFSPGRMRHGLRPAGTNRHRLAQGPALATGSKECFRRSWPNFSIFKAFPSVSRGWEDKDEDLARGSVPRQERGGGCIVRRAGLVCFENRRPRLAPAGSGGGRPRCRGRDARLRPIEVQADYRRSEVKRFRFTTANRA